MDRWEKLEWLEQTCSPDFMQNHLMHEMARWMGEDDFGEFYDHLCRMWGIARTPTELEAMAEDKMDQYDPVTDTIQEEEEEEDIHTLPSGTELVLS